MDDEPAVSPVNTGEGYLAYDRIPVKNLDKIFWPEEGITKGDVLNYYSQISSYILPHLKDRPQSLRRNPDGIGKSFFQKDVSKIAPGWVKTIHIHFGSRDEEIEWLLCQNEETLLLLANWGCIELNPWSSRGGTLDHPDYIIFDLDPLETEFRNVVKIALVIGELLDKMQIPSYVKTSGGKGLHIYVPAGAKYTYEQCRQFAKLIALKAAKKLPGMTSMERMPARRKGKIYLDFLQNGRGKTMAAAYSLRPKPGAPVSAPLHWDEVNEKLDPKNYNIGNMMPRLVKTGDLWAGLGKTSIDMAEALGRLT